jgi:hypothetical protein
MPANPEGGDAHATQAIYYTAGESEVEGCGGRPELEGLVCQTRPAAQPETPGLPDLPVTTTAYKIYGQPTVISEAVGESVRTATIEYDDAGRPLSSHLSSTDGKPLPKVQMLYDEETGLPTVQATETESIVSEYDSLGQLTAYTDADGNTSHHTKELIGCAKGAIKSTLQVVAFWETVWVPILTAGGGCVGGYAMALKNSFLSRLLSGDTPLTMERTKCKL